MIKSRWFKTEWTIPLIRLSEEMLAKQYSSLTNEGFLLTHSNLKSIKGKYVKEIIINDQFEDPLGNLHNTDRTTFNIVDFTITNNHSIGLQLKNPPKLLRDFFYELRQQNGFGFSISPITVDPLKWLHRIESKIGKTKMIQIEYSGINISNKGIAKLSIKSSKDIRNEANEFIGNRFYTINKVKLIIQNNIHNGTLELNANATAKYSENLEELLEQELFITLTDLST